MTNAGEIRGLARSTILLLAALAPLGAVAGELAGRVVDTNGAAVPGAHVVARSGAAISSAITGDDGAFEIRVPEVAHPWRLDVAANGFVTASLEDVQSGRRVEIVLQAAARFTGEVEVTAGRADVSETPVTVTNVTRAEIERGSWGQDVPIFLSDVPSFYAYNDSGNGIGYSYFFLRGFDMTRNAVSLNGVPLNDAHSHSVFFIDLADFLATTGDIQVQRGVGTTLYGGSAIGGSVDLETRAPLPERRLRVSAGAGSWGTRKIDGEYDTGLGDNGWSATFRWSKVDTDGYRDQSWVEMWNYFATVEHAGERSSTRIVAFGGPERTHLAYEGVPKQYIDGEVTGDSRRDRRFNPLTYPNEVDEFFQPHWQLIHALELSDAVTLQNTLYYFQGNGFYEQYKTGAYLPAYDLEPFPGPGGGLVDTSDLVRRRHVDEWDLGWIPHLQWDQGDGRGTLEAGVALRLHHGRHWGETTWAQTYPPDTPPNHRYYDYRLGKRTAQPFVQETWRFDPRFTLLAGVTYTSHRYEMSKDRLKGVDLTETFSYALPRLGLTYKPAAGWNVYANVSRGGREPAFRDIYDPQDYWFGDPLDLKPEKLTDWELGARHDWAHGYARFNLYYLDFSNAIVWAGGLDNNGVPVTANGAETTHKGAELELAWNPRPRWGARLALSAVNATIDRFVEFDYEGGSVDYSGNTLAGVPESLGSLELVGGVGAVDATLTLRHVGRFYLDNTEDMRKHPAARQVPDYVHRINDPYTTADLAFQMDLGKRVASALGAKRAALDLRANNLFDSLYTSFGYFDGEQPVWIPAATRTFFAGLSCDW